MDTLLWYWAVSWDYVAQMLLCMLLAALVFFLLRPWRKKRLARQGMASGKLRETALLFFVMFCAGLAALTVFPAYFWTAYHWQEALAGHEVFFPLTPSKSAGRRLGGIHGHRQSAYLLSGGLFSIATVAGKSLYAGTSDWLLYFLLRGVPTAVCGAGH